MANRVSLVTLGFFQYIGPTGMFLLAVFLYDEPLSPEKLTTFILIWSALAMLIVDSVDAYARQTPLKVFEVYIIHTHAEMDTRSQEFRFLKTILEAALSTNYHFNEF